MNRQRRPSHPNPPKRCGTCTSKSVSIVTASPGDSGCGNSTCATVRAPAGRVEEPHRHGAAVDARLGDRHRRRREQPRVEPVVGDVRQRRRALGQVIRVQPQRHRADGRAGLVDDPQARMPGQMRVAVVQGDVDVGVDRRRMQRRARTAQPARRPAPAPVSSASSRGTHGQGPSSGAVSGSLGVVPGVSGTTGVVVGVAAAVAVEVAASPTAGARP